MLHHGLIAAASLKVDLFVGSLPQVTNVRLSDHAPSRRRQMLCSQLSGTRLGPGTLYGAITRLEQQGWIEPLPPEERRRPYRITSDGLRVLRAKLTTLHQFSEAGLKRLEAL